MNKKELSNALEQLAKLRRKETEIQTQIEGYHMDIKVYMDARHLDEITHDGYRVSWKWNERNVLDMDALRREQPELLAKYTRKAKNRRFLIQANI